MAASKSRTAAEKQFPATAGDTAAEVDQRSADGSEGTRHVRQFVVLARQWGGSDGEHVANKAGVANEAIQRGLHPRGDVRFDGTADHPDGDSLVLTYSVETVPASVDHTPQSTTTPRDILKDGGV